jgi:DNA repair exonuclease SbcCD ATPase subunit
MTREELSKLLIDMYHISGIDATDDATGDILETFDDQSAEIARLNALWTAAEDSGLHLLAEVERLKAEFEKADNERDAAYWKEWEKIDSLQAELDHQAKSWQAERDASEAEIERLGRSNVYLTQALHDANAKVEIIHGDLDQVKTRIYDIAEIELEVDPLSVINFVEWWREQWVSWQTNADHKKQQAAEIERLRAALEKYADPVNWEWIRGIMYSDTVAKHFVPPADFDHRIAEKVLRPQSIARAALVENGEVEIERLQAQIKGTCKWTLDDSEYGVWDTGCGEAVVFEVETPEANGYKYCHYCGKLIEFDREVEG